MTFSDKIKRARYVANLTQEELADAIGVSRRTVASYESQGVVPRKSTLAKLTFPQKKYVSFDEKSMREMAKSNPKDFLLAFPDGAIIDEAQKVPEIFDAIKFHVDNNKFEAGKYILTGSSQFKLKENMSDCFDINKDIHQILYHI